MSMSLEMQDTFLLYGTETLARVIGLNRHEFGALPADVRAALIRHQVASGRRLVPSLRSVPSSWRASLRPDGDGHRFVWWRETLERCGDDPVLQFVADDMLTSKHDQVHESTWDRAKVVLPAARDLAGTFADSSGPNCFGTVMAAAGVANAADAWMLREPFEAWLADATHPGGVDAQPGTVMLWRDRRGSVQHAAVTLGGGWALHKPSQGWMTPRKVLSVQEVKGRARHVGHWLSRRTITPVRKN